MTSQFSLPAGSAPAGRAAASAEDETMTRESYGGESVSAEWARLYGMEFQNVKRQVMLYGASREDAEDAAQDAFAMLLDMAAGNPNRWKAIESKTAFVRKVAKNHYLRLLVKARALVPWDGLPESVSEDPAPEARTVGNQSVLESLRSLEGDTRTVAALQVDGFSAEEIALSLGISPVAVRLRMRQARENLRGVLSARMDEDPPEPPGTQRASEPGPRAGRQASPDDDDPPTLAALPPRQREVLRLSRDGYKPAQIAAVLSLNPNTVRVNLYHARKRVRRNLEVLASAPALSDRPSSALAAGRSRRREGRGRRRPRSGRSGPLIAYLAPAPLRISSDEAPEPAHRGITT